MLVLQLLKHMFSHSTHEILDRLALREPALGEAARSSVEALLARGLVSQAGETFAVVEPLRSLLLVTLAKKDALAFRKLSLHFAEIFSNGTDAPATIVEEIYHTIAASPETGGHRLLDTALAWNAEPFFASDAVDRLV